MEVLSPHEVSGIQRYPEKVSGEVRVKSDFKLTSCSVRGGLKRDGLFCIHSTQRNYVQCPVKQGLAKQSGVSLGFIYIKWKIKW